METNTAVKTIVFEPHGQDFSEWDIDSDGNVVGVRPEREGWLSVWMARRVENYDLSPGDTVMVQIPELAYLNDKQPPMMPVKFPVLFVYNICSRCGGRGQMPAPDGWAICTKCVGRGKY